MRKYWCIPFECFNHRLAFLVRSRLIKLIMKIIVCVFVSLLLVDVWTAHLPSYITPCKLSDPNFSRCAVKSANQAIGSLASGDKKYKIQNLNPIIIPEVKIETGPNSRLSLQNVTTYDLKNSRITYFNVDPNEKTLKCVGVIERLEMEAQYDVIGVLFSIPIKGSGRGNVTIVNGNYSFDANYTLQTVNNEEYLHITDRKFVFDAERSYFYLDNIFGNNKELSDELNNNINENWDVLAKEVYPFFGEVMESVTESVMNGIFKNVPFKEVFLP